MQNLWAGEGNNIEITTQHAGRAAKAGAARTISRKFTEQKVVSALRAWLLNDYVAPYCRSLAATRIFRRCFLIDGLGYMNGGRGDRAVQAEQLATNTERQADKPAVGAINRPLQDGLLGGLSPEKMSTQKRGQKASAPLVPAVLEAVVALAQELGRERRSITLQAILLEGSRRKRNQSERGFSLPKESSVISADWVEIAPALLGALEQSAAIFLLNPLRRPTSKGALPFFSVDDLALLFRRTTPTELCLLLSHTSLEELFLPALHTPTGASAFTALLRNDRWKSMLAGGAEAGHMVDSLIDLWRAALQRHFLWVQRVAFPMLIGPATVEEAPCTLLFATRRQDSLACMNDAVCSYRRHLEEESHQGLLNEAWFAAQQQEGLAAALEDLRNQTLRLGRAQAPRRWPDLRQHLLLANFGAFTTHDYDETMARLLEEGEVRCEWRNRVESTGEAHRVPGNDDTLLWSQKKRRY